MKKDTVQPDQQLAGVCGLFCPGCLIYIAQQRPLKVQERIAASLKLPVEALRCGGCRSNNKFAFCDGCKIADCAVEKGISFCNNCDQYPCEVLEKFQAEMPHRVEIWKNLKRIKELGYVKWFREMLEHYSCKKCKTINSAYHTSCLSCSATPGNVFAEKHKSEIERFIAINMQEPLN